MQVRPMPSCGVRPSVRPSVAFIHSVKTSKHIFKKFSASGSHTILIFSVPNYMAVLQRGPLTGASNAGGVCTNRDSEPKYGFIACRQRCDRRGVINTVPPDRGKLWHLVSGGICWWRETTTKCLWQEVSTLRQRQQNSI